MCLHPNPTRDTVSCIISSLLVLGISTYISSPGTLETLDSKNNPSHNVLHAACVHVFSQSWCFFFFCLFVSFHFVCFCLLVLFLALLSFILLHCMGEVIDLQEVYKVEKGTVERLRGSLSIDFPRELPQAPYVNSLPLWHLFMNGSHSTVNLIMISWN